jgi:uncharacterized protein
MGYESSRRYTVFEGAGRVASGDLMQGALCAKELLDRGGSAAVLIFDDATGEQVDVDLGGTADDVRKRLSAPAEPNANAVRGRGRPKLGVVAREVTLLPRHWDWLNSQPGGASVALRKLVDEARRVNENRNRLRGSQTAAYRFMSAIAGNFPGFEEAIRALFAGNRQRFEEHTGTWPADVREYAKQLASDALDGTP